MSNVRILIVDDKPLVRKGIRMFLELEEGLTVCGEAADGLEGIKKAFDLKPDVVLLDPPYTFDAFELLLARLEAATVLVEHRSPVSVPVRYGVSREYRYGGTLVTLLEAAQGAAQAAQATWPAVPETDKDHP